MINFFIIRKWGGILIATFLPTITFFIGLQFFGFWAALAAFFFGVIVGGMLCNVMIKNVFSAMLEGKGLLMINLDSTGIMKPFICNVDQPYIKAIFNKKKVNDVFDRDAVFNLNPPLKAGKMYKDSESNRLLLMLDDDLFNKARFGMLQYPVLIYNDQIKSLLTKDYLSNQEKQSFAEHSVLYMNRKLEEVTSILREFGRYVVELTKPKTSIFANPWVRAAIVVVLIILAIMFAKPIMASIQKVAGGSSLGAVTPRFILGLIK